MTRSLFPGYFIVAQMGHLEFTGLVSEIEVCGEKMLCIDFPGVPEDENREALPADFRLIRAHTVFSMSPCSEGAVLAARLRQRPYKTREYKMIEAVEAPEAAPEEEEAF